MAMLLLLKQPLNCKNIYQAISIFYNFYLFRPFLDKLLEFQNRSQTKMERRLQLVSTDTWDITDEMSKYSNIANLLIVS